MKHHRQSSPLRAIVLLRRVCQTCLFRRELDHTVFVSLDFTAVTFTEEGCQPCVQTQTWRAGPCIMSPREREVQLYPQAPGSLPVAFYGLQGYRGGILTRPHTGRG
jgi:hypothetical protein